MAAGVGTSPVGTRLRRRADAGDLSPEAEAAVQVGLIVLCLFFPFVAVMLHGEPLRKVLIALVLQLLGHFPGVVYGLVQVTRG